MANTTRRAVMAAIRNRRRAKTVLTEVGPTEISVPRDRDFSFEPKIVVKRQRRLSGGLGASGADPVLKSA